MNIILELMSKYDHMFDLKIKVDHSELSFMVHMKSSKLFDNHVA